MKNKIKYILIVVVIIIVIGCGLLIIKNLVQNKEKDEGTLNPNIPYTPNSAHQLSCSYKKEGKESHELIYVLYIEENGTFSHYDFKEVLSFDTYDDYNGYISFIPEDELAEKWQVNLHDKTIIREEKNKQMTNRDGESLSVSEEYYKKMLEKSGYVCSEIK